jgi:hypothetical protein
MKDHILPLKNNAVRSEVESKMFKNLNQMISPAFLLGGSLI